MSFIQGADSAGQNLLPVFLTHSQREDIIILKINSDKGKMKVIEGIGGVNGEMELNKKKKSIIGITQSGLILVLVVLIIFMMVQINRLQGTARVINYAGLVRGATQREVKLEITGNQN